MTLRLKIALGLAFAAFAVCHVAAAVTIDAMRSPAPMPIAMLDAD
jgi:hypothetical protein